MKRKLVSISQDDLVSEARGFAWDAKHPPITFKRLLKELGNDFDRQNKEGLFQGFLAGWEACEKAILEKLPESEHALVSLRARLKALYPGGPRCGSEWERARIETMDAVMKELDATAESGNQESNYEP